MRTAIFVGAIAIARAIVVGVLPGDLPIVFMMAVFVSLDARDLFVSMRNQ